MKASKHGSKYKITYRCPNFDKTISEYFNSEEEANLRIAQIKLERKLGTLKPPAYLLDPDKDRDLFRQSMTVEQLMNEYLTLYGLNHWSEGTLSCNRHRINDYIIPYIGHLKIQDLTTHRLEQFYRELQTKPAVRLPGHKAEDKTISPSVVEKVHALIRSALNQAIRWDYLRNGNPAMAVELPRYRKNKREAWTDQEAREALSLCTDPILKLCMFLALGCSMRIGEILGLTWDCVHLEEDLRISDDAYLTVNKELRRCDKKSLQELRDKGRDDVFYEYEGFEKPWKKEKNSLVVETDKARVDVVEKDGSLQHFSVIRNDINTKETAASLHVTEEEYETFINKRKAAFENVVINILQSMPKWQPAIHETNGKKEYVRMKYTMPFTFRLQ